MKVCLEDFFGKISDVANFETKMLGRRKSMKVY